MKITNDVTGKVKSVQEIVNFYYESRDFNAAFLIAEEKFRDGNIKYEDMILWETRRLDFIKKRHEQCLRDIDRILELKDFEARMSLMKRKVA